MANETRQCSNCKWRKPNKTCKETPRHQTGDYDWCNAWKKKQEPASGYVSRELREKVLKLRTEVNCRIEHGAESNGHLDYVQSELDKILKKGI